jgi:DNA topoisomerase IA
MAGKDRGRSIKTIRYFFLNGKIHKVISSSRAKDQVIAWCYPDAKRVLYPYSEVNKHMGNAYSVVQVADMLNKHRVTIQDYILEEKIKAPQKIYPIGSLSKEGWSKYMFSEEDILDLHQYILDSGHSNNMPSKAELLALLKHSFVLYTKTSSGFVPVWKAD